MMADPRIGGRAGWWTLLALHALGPALPPRLPAQGIGAGTGGTASLHQAERMLGKNQRVLMIGAHPDDEDTELLTTLVRGHGVEAAYLSLSRGEGGQNLLGPELGEGLGLIRTEELLAARSLDGARQYFGRMFDFGFSRSIEEAARFWPRDTVLKDVVRIIRRFRPHIIVAVFSGTPRDGHGQHQMSGWAAQEGFRAAADPGRFPELAAEEGLRPWQPSRLYRSTRFDPNATTVSLDGGVLDPDVGQSYRQIAMRGRSLHRSQDMGVLQEPGPSTVRLMLMAEQGTAAGGGSDLWSGIDTSAVPLSGDGIESRDQRRHRAAAAAIRAGLVFDAWARDGRIIPGQRVNVQLTAWNGGSRSARVDLSLQVPPGWTAEPCQAPSVSLAPGTMTTCEFTVIVAPGAPLSTPYFLGLPRTGPGGGLYQWTGPREAWGEPFEPPPLQAVFQFSVDSSSHQIGREVVHRYRDQALGEVRHPVFVVPRVDVKLDPPAKVWSTGWTTPQEFTVTLQHGAADTTVGTVALELPAGWPGPPPQPFALTRPEEREALTFLVRAPPSLPPGRYPIRAVATDRSGTRYQAGLYQVEYSHIRPRVWSRPAETLVEAAAIAFPKVARIGYVRGASDRVPEALLSVGLPVEVLDQGILERGDLSRYGVIVVGSRAYETDAALRENNTRLLEYARAGGRLLVQYQQQPFFAGRFAPAPLTLAQPHDRVTDETAPVTVLEPSHPVFSRPNRITPADWDGWIQERGLYFARSWDSTYTPLLALADSGQAPLRGGLLVRSLGRGSYVYTGLSFFRQLPAGIPGAFRLFLNLLDP